MCIIADRSGHVLGVGTNGPSNYFTAGEGRMKRSITSAVKIAVEKASMDVPKFETVCVGIAGAGIAIAHRSIDRFIKESIIAKKFIIESDAVIALWGAITREHGVVVNSGTGSFAFGVNKRGERRRVNGWGYLAGDEGSGYDIGRKGMVATFRAYDGRGEETILVDKLMKHFRVSSLDKIMERIYLKPIERHEVAALASLVIEAAKKGDKVAINLLRKSGRELGSATNAVIKGLRMEDEKFEIAPTGGVFKFAGKFVLDPFKWTVKKVAPIAKIISPRFPPVVGAVLLALKESGVQIDEKLLSELKASERHRVHLSY